MEHKGVKNSDRQSFRRGGEREGSRVGIYQPSAQHLRCHPPSLFHCLPPKNICPTKISHKTALNRWILRWERSVNGYKTVEMWESGVLTAGPGGWEVRSTSLQRRSVNLPRTFLSLIQSNLTLLCLNLKIPGINWSDISPIYIFQDKTYYRGSGDFLAETKML